MNKIWDINKRIEFSKVWQEAKTDKIDDLLPSWSNSFFEIQKNNDEYVEFLERLKRIHAIETGVIENLYSLSRGVTELFVEKGLNEAFLRPDDSNQSTSWTFSVIKDQSSALDYIFDFIKNESPFTEHFIKSLHSLVTNSQTFIQTKNQFGETQKQKLEKGIYKNHPNNPQRPDGTQVFYCPPEHTETEMANLVAITNQLMDKAHPVVLSAWLHHCFTKIHPFQDGNGRVARLLGSLILIKHHLFPLTITHSQRVEYIMALEEADNDNVQVLVDFFCENQKTHIENALSLQPKKSEKAINLLKDKIKKHQENKQLEQKKLLEEARNRVYQYLYKIVGNHHTEIAEALSKELFEITVSSKDYNDTEAHFFTYQIIQNAKENNYFFRKNNPRAWFRLGVKSKTNSSISLECYLIISLHHFGYGEDSMTLTGFILDKTFFDNSQISQSIEEDQANIKTENLLTKPYFFSLIGKDNSIILPEKQLKEQLNKMVEDFLLYISNNI